MSRHIGPLLILLVLLAGCGAEEPPGNELLPPHRPDWQRGLWTGRLAFEHDTTSHRLRIHFRDRSFAYPGRPCMGTLAVDSVAPTLLRVRLEAGPTANDCGPLAGGTAEVRPLDDTTMLHLQYWPEGEARLHLAQLRRPAAQARTPPARR